MDLFRDPTADEVARFKSFVEKRQGNELLEFVDSYDSD
jgi:hypothetical protein